jgi:hypothetical protein
MYRLALFVWTFLVISAVYAGDHIVDKLESIYREYEAIKQDNSENAIKELIRLDQELRALIIQPQMIGAGPLDAKYWNKKYESIGVYVLQYDGTLDYSGLMLEEVKRRDVNKRYEAYTSGPSVPSISWGGVPDDNIKAALQYESKFPTGPFIKEALILIGDFYSDLYLALKHRDEKDYKYDCYSPYFDTTPIADQIESARTTAIMYYARALALSSKGEDVDQLLRHDKLQLESGAEPSWHYCAD